LRIALSIILLLLTGFFVVSCTVGLLMSSSSDEADQTPPSQVSPPQAPVASLSVADEAACAALAGYYEQLGAGVTFDAVVKENGWPAGKPSDAVIGAYNQYRTVEATYGDFLAGVATEADVTAATEDAVFAFQSACIK
jgi:hypothetical protein